MPIAHTQVAEIVGADVQALKKVIDTHYESFTVFSGAGQKLTSGGGGGHTTGGGSSSGNTSAVGGFTTGGYILGGGGRTLGGGGGGGPSAAAGGGVAGGSVADLPEGLGAEGPVEIQVMMVLWC